MSQKGYIGIWVLLVVLVGVSIALGATGNLRLALTGIFGVAVFKAYLVLSYYMHLKHEARFVKVMLFSGFLCLVILFWGLVPDIVMDPHK